MRIVNNLQKTAICPNCGSDTLLSVQHPAEMTQSKFCPNCREEIFEEVEEEDDDDCCFAVPGPGFFFMEKKQKEEEEREQLLFEARDLLHDLPHFARTEKELDTLTQICNIFDKILTLLERK